MAKTIVVWAAVFIATLSCSSEETGNADGNIANAVPCIHTTIEDPMRRDTDILPTGRCVEDPNEPVCKLILRDPCPCTNVVPPKKWYSCSCANNTWACELTAQTKGVCPGPGPCVLEDGGVLDGGEGGSG